MPKVIKSEKVPDSMRSVYEQIVELTNAFCKEHLNEEYAQMIRYATAALCRKRPSPVTRGRINTWACGITYAIGSVNYLFDRSQTPSISAAALCDAFGVAQKTGAAKAKIVRDLFGMFQMHPDWSLESLVAENPLIWMIQVNGLIMDARRMPREVQEIAYNKGLIPYIPADKA